MHLDLYYVDMKYIRDLSRANNHLYNVSPQSQKENRPFLGIVTILDNKPYCIPLTSPKDKFKGKSAIDIIKIFDENKKNEKGAPKLIGVLNLNDMIPIDKRLISKVDLRIFKTDTPQEANYKHIMQKQIKWCREHSEVIRNRSNKVYTLVMEAPEKNRALVKRCSDFKRLEGILEVFMEKHFNIILHIKDEKKEEIGTTKKDVRGFIKKKAQEISKQPHKEQPSKDKDKNSQSR